MHEDPNNKTTRQRPALQLAEGDIVMSALEALLKGVLESEIPIEAVFAPVRGPFRLLSSIKRDEITAELFKRHGCRLELVNEPGRAIELAARTCSLGRNVVLMLPSGDAMRAASGVARARAALQGATGFGLVLVVEDDLD